MRRNEFGKVKFSTKSISNVTFGLSDFCLHQLWCKLYFLGKITTVKKKQIFTKVLGLKI